MIEIDGSYGEGGGQILRTAIALSAIIKEDVTIKNIRRNRPKEGLKPQHLKSIETIAMICDADVKGLFPGSTQIYFSPSEIRGVKTNISIGTAGSIPLLMQSIMPIAAHSPEKTSLRITGGTDVAWSPSIDYIKEVTLKALSKMGYRASIRLIERGYYPKGGGAVEIEITPSRIKGVDFKAEKNEIYGVSHCSNLPEHVAKRQADSARKLLEEYGRKSHIESKTENYLSTGSGITLWSGLMGSVNIGKKGLPAENVGSQAAQMLLDELLAKAAVDIHLADQLIPYMGIAGNGSFTTRELTPHCLTNIHVTEQFLDVHFAITRDNGLNKISVE
ncbi:RNA 3'-terminal phosphate cyclase [Methanolobus mangrovi]|uniref:RNA 3'-terminal phosphate cyclase n=1 Tax=Methanolobus mangrovi TaxID=3072977 RepID=A0AA51YG93_9EURY|nr:RNA 3'-terminal phosphate cyclase [Methanolobus mangrovi]WMW21781.1 RNA 3'-terminal phosphate cyclase [Methanolobus mangrovi]